MDRWRIGLVLGGLVVGAGCSIDEARPPENAGADPNACENDDWKDDDGGPQDFDEESNPRMAHDLVAPADPYAGAFEVGTPWDKRVLEVCFTQSGNQTERNWIRRTIDESWEAVSGVRFTGWGTCADENDGDISIELTEHGDGGTSLFGTDSLQAYPSMTITIDYERAGCGHFTPCDEGIDDNGKTGRQNCIEEVAKHEFGHALALRHEQARPDSKCESDEDFDVPGSLDGQELWSYDDESIMDYCHLATEDNTPLSLGDVRTINSLYPGQVRVFAGSSFSGESQSFAWGSWLGCDMKYVQGDEINSIVVPPGMRARVCTDASGTDCETFTASANLSPSLAGNVARIDVDARLQIYDDPGFRGDVILYLEPGTYFGPGLWWAIIEDAASSVIVPPGIAARLCTDESNGQGAGACLERFGHEAMEFRLPPGHDNDVSFAEVRPRVVSYTGQQYRDELHSYDLGVYRESDGSLPHPADIESFSIPYGMQVRACTEEGDGSGGGTCTRLRRSAAEIPSAIVNAIRYLEVQTSDSVPTDFMCSPGFD